MGTYFKEIRGLHKGKTGYSEGDKTVGRRHGIEVNLQEITTTVTGH